MSNFRFLNPSINCIYLELPKDLQPAFDDYLSGKTDDFETVVHFAKPPLGTPPESAEVLYGFIRALKPLIEDAKKNKIKVFAADIDESSLEDDKKMSNPKIELGERNRNFARAIKADLSSDTCKASVFIVGAMHLLMNSEDGDFIDLRSTLNEAAIPSASILHSSKNPSLINPLHPIPGCDLQDALGIGNSPACIVVDHAKHAPFIWQDESIDYRGVKIQKMSYNQIDLMYFE